MSYQVVGVTDDAVELWDGKSRVEPDRRERATMTCFVGRSHAFQVTDVVDVIVVLRERKGEDT